MCMGCTKGNLLMSPVPASQSSKCMTGGYIGFTLSVRPSVRTYVRTLATWFPEGFKFQISNSICMLLVAIGRSLLIFSDVTFKMTTWRPYGIFRFPDSNFSLTLNIKSKLHLNITFVYGKQPIDFQRCNFQNGRLAVILDFSSSEPCSWHGFRSITRVCFGISISNFICILFVAMDQRLLILRYVTFEMAAWQSYCFSNSGF